MKKILNKLLQLTCLFVFCILLTAPVHAEGESVQLKSCKSLDASTVELQANIQSFYIPSCDIYRGTSPNKLAFIDTIHGYSSWRTYDFQTYQCEGEKGKVICAASDSDLRGNVIFYDTTVSPGNTYYYQLVLKSQSTIKSNAKSCKVQLSAPVIKSCYARSNSKVVLTWEKVPKANGYKIYRQSGKKWKLVKTIKKGSTLKYTNTKLKSGTTYKYKICAYYKKGGKVYAGKYSKVMKVKLKQPTVKGNYKTGSVYGPSLSSSKLNDVRRVVQSFKDNYIKSNMNTYTKVQTAYNYLRANCRYAWKGWQYNNANTAWGALVYGEAQCSGYARAMKALCDAIGVPCYYVHANAKASNPNHQWNLIKVDKKWYIVDAQGGFFLFGSKEWKSFTGLSWNTKGLPTCNKSNHKKAYLSSSEI